MSFFGRILWVWLALLVVAGRAAAAGPTREQQAYETAVAAFAKSHWSIAELEFDEFAKNFPDSTRVPQAGILQAQAAIKQGKFAPAEALLSQLRPKAGKLADDCTYWLGEAQFQRGDLPMAEVTLASVSTNSPLALQANVEAGAAMARLGQWRQLLNLFQDDQALFQNAGQTDPDNEMLQRGYLLTAQANLAQTNYPAAARLLAAIKPEILPPALKWERVDLLCQVKLAQNDLEAALPLATESVATARQLTGADLGANLSDSIALRATVLERLGRAADAMAAYGENLAANAPEDRQQQAILRIAALAIDQQQYTNAELKLNDYVTQFTNAPALDAAWLTLGELYLRDYTSQPGQANLLAAARAWLDELLAAHPHGSFAGKAYLDRGWCAWLARDYAECLPDFQNAVRGLPSSPSEDLAVARFKLADTLFARADFAGALTNYQAVLRLTNDLPRVMASLGDRALYQSLRAQLKLNDAAGASNSMVQIAAAYPVSELRESSALLLGQGYADLGAPTNALAVFQSFLDQSPHSPLRPSVELAIARAYEEEQNWTAAIAQYESWLKEFPTNDLLAPALYSRAWATYQAGDETNALILFTNFVAKFPVNDLAPTAQWWVADYYWAQGDSVNAERNYKFIFQNTNWQNSALFYPAQIMAGKAALSRTDNGGAIRDYFQKLEVDTNCPLELRVQATFLHGSALMKMESSDTNNPTTNFLGAVNVFSSICQSFPTNETGARAWGMSGDCYLQLGSLDAATNAYWQALTYAGTNLLVQNEAQIGLGVVLEKKAAQLPAGDPQANLLTQAAANYWNVLQGASRAGNQPEFWAEEAGLKAANLAEGRGEWEEATNFYGELLRLRPELQAMLARKIDAANQHLTALKKPAR